MNLKLDLMLRIVLVAAACLAATAAFVLYQSNVEARSKTSTTAETLVRQLDFQLQRIAVSSDLPERFPDLALWADSSGATGLCVRFNGIKGGTSRSICRGGYSSAPSWPGWFEALYRSAFHPGMPVVRQVAFSGRTYGTVTVTPDAESAVARAWKDLRELLTLSLITVVALCVLIYASVDRALRPARLIVAALRKMADGQLALRLPRFEIAEWRYIGGAVNQLAGNLEQALAERRDLTLKLMNVQDQERRYLARELHDEFGQCLAAINAVAASIDQTAKDECPALVPGARSISRTAGQMGEVLRNLLGRLRPTEVDELGLTQSLTSLVAGWNARSGGGTRYELRIDGDIDGLPDPVPVNVYRIVQECLTNVSKHAAARAAVVALKRQFPTDGDAPCPAGVIEILVEDDGVADVRTLTASSGSGLLGIRERVTALDGGMTLTARAEGGLSVRITIPLAAASRAPVYGHDIAN